MNRELTGLSSMATRQLLAALSEQLRDVHSTEVRFESAGGVEVARRVREGAGGDLLVLAADAMAALEAAGLLAVGTLRPLWVSQVVAAVPSGAPLPALASESDLRAALLAARRIAYSTGPSGTALVELTSRLGLAEELAPRLVQAPPGVPAGSLLASGAADLAFQQQSELMDLPGVVVVGPLPGDAAISTTFSGAVLAASTAPDRAAEALDLLGAEETWAIARTKGLRAAGDLD